MLSCAVPIFFVPNHPSRKHSFPFGFLSFYYPQGVSRKRGDIEVVVAHKVTESLSRALNPQMIIYPCSATPLARDEAVCLPDHGHVHHADQSPPIHRPEYNRASQPRGDRCSSASLKQIYPSRISTVAIGSLAGAIHFTHGEVWSQGACMTVTWTGVGQT